jgi:hypothetical protein
MQRETVYRCAASDCDTFVHSYSPPPVRGWIAVHERDGESVTDLDFCGWNCLLRFSATIDPDVVIDADGLL